ncbi:MAG: hypothetical protein ACYC5H_18625 [Methylovirgula sp.]
MTTPHGSESAATEVSAAEMSTAEVRATGMTAAKMTAAEMAAERQGRLGPGYSCRAYCDGQDLQDFVETMHDSYSKLSRHDLVTAIT